MKKLLFFLACIFGGACSQNMQELGTEMQINQYLKDVDIGILYCNCTEPLTLSFSYPVKPGMDEWKQLQSIEEMVNACQIPESIISSLSTKELMAICLQYPLLFTVFAYNNYDDGIDKLFNDFNGIRELFKRQEVSNELLSWYKCQIENFSFLDGEFIPEVEKGFFVISTSILEALLSRCESKEHYGEILQNLVVGYEKKLEYNDFFAVFGVETNFFSRAHIIHKMCEQCFKEFPQIDENKFLSSHFEKQTMDAINKLSYQLIN